MQLLSRKRPIAIILALALPTGAMTIFMALGPPRLLARSEAPEFCGGCHVMGEQYTAWSHAGAHRRLRCVDCHLPNANPLEHYVWKGIDGMKDVVSFHTGLIPERIELSEHGKKVLQANCVRCHAAAVAQMDTSRQCWGCHRQLRHRQSGSVATR